MSPATRALAGDSDDASLNTVRAFLTRLEQTHRRLVADDLYPLGTTPVITAGGSAYFDDVADILGPLTAEGVRVVLRSGRT